jgi:mycothiol synthase
MQSPQVERADRLVATEIHEVLALVRAAGDTDGADPLSEQVLLHLRLAGEQAPPHLMIRAPDGTLVGYAHLDAGEAGGAAAELAVHPLRRRRGLGRALVSAAVESTAGPLHIWAHGDHPAAAALALDLGFERARVLLQLRRPLTAPLPEPHLPAGVSLRAFRPGEDDEAWLAVNRRAFADHPEQGRWSLDDLRVRMSEPWFDPAGFLLAVEEPTGRLLGFHWTKVHGRESGPADRESGSADRESGFAGPDGAGASRPEPIGEVYVLGVDPDAHGLGLGKVLTAAGLLHLRSRGLARAMLYVDESNTGAMALYTRLGFARWSADVRYRRPATPD